LDFSLTLREPKRDFKRGFVVKMFKVRSLYSLNFIISEITLRELLKEIEYFFYKINNFILINCS